MKNIARPVNRYKAYHAHIYFDKETLEHAIYLSQQAKTIFNLAVGPLHQRPLGPHPMWNCQITFTKKNFSELIPWLEENRHGLTIFIHGLTGNDLKDHTEHAYWLGDSVALNLAIFGGQQKTQSY